MELPRTHDRPASARTRVRRLPDRGVYGARAVASILDEGFVCHLGFVADGQPYVIPTCYGRDGEVLYVHGSPASRMLRTLSGPVDCCLTVTLVDGLVLARSAFHHSVNYRSVVVLGRARAVQDEAERLHALEVIVEHIVPGRWVEARPPSAKELRATTVLALPLAEASAKVRSGPPVDDDEDVDPAVWAGVLPLAPHTPLAPVGEPGLRPGLPAPPSLTPWRRPGGGASPQD
jgi:nitroimidazol reductase NimA-like FMN-containing flavoprotein (pyridoxamine 5'-phosphate oxidase superfamily)